MYIKSSNDKYYVFYNKNKHIGNILIKFDERNFYRFLYRIYTTKSKKSIKKIYYLKDSEKDIKSINNYILSLETILRIHIWNDFNKEKYDQQLLITKKNINLDYIKYIFK